MADNLGIINAGQAESNSPTGKKKSAFAEHF